MFIRAFTLLALLATAASCGQDPTTAILRADAAADSSGAPRDSVPTSPAPGDSTYVPPDSVHVPPDSAHVPPTPSDTAYDGDTTVVVRGAVTASRVNGGVRVINGTTEPVAYAVWNPNWLALFAPCVDSTADCPRLAPGVAVVIPDRAIGGFDSGATQAVVRWWHVVPDGAGGNRADLVREILVTL